MRRESRTGSSGSTRVAQCRTRLANRDAVGRMISILFDWTFDPEPRCMLSRPGQVRTTHTGMLDIDKHSKTLWNLQLLNIFRVFAEIRSFHGQRPPIWCVRSACARRNRGCVPHVQPVAAA